MTELLVILGLCLVGLALSAHLVRWLMARPVGDADMNRIANLAREAAEGFTRRQTTTTGALAALLAGVVFLAYGLRSGGAGDPVPGLELGGFMTLSFAVGAASAVLVAHAATALGARSAIRVASGALRSTDEALRCALRGGGAVALLTGTTSAFGLGALVLAVLVARGAFGDTPQEALAAIPTLPLLLSGHALGAGFAALFVQLSGGAFAKGADVGADVGAREAGLDDDDVDNPAAIADLAGDTAGAASRAAGALASAAVEDLGAMLAGAAVYALDAGIPSALAVVLFPTLTRSFGVLGAAFGSLVVRTDDRESPAAALSRGLGITVVLHGVGLAGAAQWLLPDRTLAVVACAAIGVAAAAALVPWSHAAVSAERARVRDLADASRAGPSHALLTGLGTGLDATLVPAALGAAALLGAASLGARLGGPGGATLGLAMALLGASGGASYLLALDLASSAGDAALGVIEMTVGRDRRDVRGRLLLLGLAGTVHGTLSRAQGALAALLGGGLLASALATEAARRGAGELTTLAPYAAVAAALAGAGLGAWVFTRATLGATRCARRVLEEVRRQLRDRAPAEQEPRASRRGATPRSPDYGPCVELAARFSLRYAFSPALAAVAVPVACALVLRWAQSGDKELLVGPIVALVVAATVAGVLGSLLASTAGGAWANARKYIVTGAHGGRLLVDESGARAENPTYQAAVVGDTTGDPLKDAGAPALLIFVKLLPVLFLVLLPFLL